MPNDKEGQFDNDENSTKKKVFCPNCKGENLFTRNVEVSGSERKIVLKKQRTHIEDRLKEEEILGVACKDCGFVFFILKGYM